MMTRLGNWRRYFRQRSLMATGRVFIDRFVYRSQQCVVVSSGLAGPPAADRVGDIFFRLARPSDFDHLDELEQYGRGSTRHRTYVEEDKDWLFIACRGKRIVATRRAGRVIRDSLMSRVIQLRPEQIWAADVFCCPSTATRGSPVILCCLETAS